MQNGASKENYQNKLHERKILLKKGNMYVDITNLPRDKNFFRPDDKNKDWDYSNIPDPEKYHKKYGNLNQYEKDYEKWLERQYEKK